MVIFDAISLETSNLPVLLKAVASRTRSNLAVLALFAVLQALTANSLMAGGDHTAVKLLRFDSVSETRNVVQIRLIAKSYFFGKCYEATLLLDYVPEWFWKREWGKDILNRANYDEGISVLKTASEAHKDIFIGAMGEGFAPVEGKDCTFQSHGLFVVKVGSEHAVYSLHQ